MALPGLGINPSQAQRLRKQKYSPLGNRFKNQLQLERAANQRTYGAIHPKLQAETEEGMATRSAHRGRTQDLTQNYDYMDQQVKAAQQKAQAALDNVLATTNTSTTEAGNNLAAALARSREGSEEQANAVGGVLPAGNADQVAQAVTATGDTSLGSLGQRLGEVSSANAQGITRAALERVRALQDEAQRFGAKIGLIQKAKTGIKKEIPAVKEQERENLENAEVAKATERSREKIAKGSLHIEGRNATTAEKEAEENKRHHEAEEGISWGAIRAEKAKYKNQVAGAKNEAQKERAEAEQAKYNSGVNIFAEYMQGHKPKEVNPKDLYRNLTLAVPPAMALEIMKHTSNKRILAFVASREGGGKQTNRVPGSHPVPGAPAGPSGPVGNPG